MKLLTLITARGGSKRIPGKNLRILGGKPLICWSIDIAKKISQISDILVSTDDPDIQYIALNSGVMAPWLRPKFLSTDNANSVDVSIHALNWYEEHYGEVDGLILLQPTSPFRSQKNLVNGIDLFIKKEAPVVAVSPVLSHPMWSFKIEKERLIPYIDNEGLKLKSQDLPKAYIVNGSFYLISPKDLRSRKSFYSDNMTPLIVEDPVESIDIDTEWDWKIAEWIFKDYTLFNKKFVG